MLPHQVREHPLPMSHLTRRQHPGLDRKHSKGVQRDGPSGKVSGPATLPLPAVALKAQRVVPVGSNDPTVLIEGAAVLALLAESLAPA